MMLTENKVFAETAVAENAVEGKAEVVTEEIVTEEFAAEKIKRVLQESGKERIIVAIDGRCAAGKTTVAGKLAERLSKESGGMGVNLIHMDDFFLRPEQRTEERLMEPGGNVDRERVRADVLLPLSNGENACYRPFDCHTQSLKEPINVMPEPVTIVEGAYACHPELREFYDLAVFMDVDPKEQIRRIRLRNGEAGVKNFKMRWIPLEEQYFLKCHVREWCDLCVTAEQVLMDG